MTAHPSNDTTELIRRCVEGVATAEETAALREALRDSPEARDLYVDYLRIHAMLQFPHDEQSEIEPEPAQETYPIYRAGHEPKPALSPAKVRMIYALSGVAAALLVAFGLAAYLLSTSADPQPDPSQPGFPIATLIESTGGNLTTPHDYPAEGNQYAAGDYALASGHAQFVLTNRVTVDLRGDTRLRMYNPSNIALTRGNAEFKVPADVDGFTVHLPDRSRIVDLGTAFRVEVDPDGATELRVTQGSVAWNATDDAEPVVLTAGHTVRIVDGRITARTNETTLLATDFTGVDHASADTLSNVTWNTVVGVTHPDAPLVFTGPIHGFFTQPDRVAINRNLANEGAWSTQLPLELADGTHEIKLTELSLRAFAISKTGTPQAKPRVLRFTARVTGSRTGSLGSAHVDHHEDGLAKGSIASIDLSELESLNPDETYTLTLTASAEGHGVHAAIDDLDLRGKITIESNPTVHPHPTGENETHE